jgi:hypothetical protein
MNLQSAFNNINWLSVLVASVSAFAIGSLWYSSFLVGKVWQKELKLSDDDIKNTNMPMIFGLAFLMEFIAAMVLDMFIGREATLWSGLAAGALVSIAWIATSIGTNYLFARRSFRLFLIDSGYFVIFFVVIGAILGAW